MHLVTREVRRDAGEVHAALVVANMSPGRVAKLVAIAPRFLRDWERCEFRCHDGWFNLLHELFVQVEALGADVVCQQVKEKLGTLRVYCVPRNADVDALVRTAENLSHSSCELCGAPDAELDEVNGRWLKTLCDACAIAESLR